MYHFFHQTSPFSSVYKFQTVGYMRVYTRKRITYEKPKDMGISILWNPRISKEDWEGLDLIDDGSSQHA